MELLERPLTGEAVDERLDALVRRHARAGNAGIDLLNLIGGQAENLLDRLPPEMRARLGEGAAQALQLAMQAAGRSRHMVNGQPAWLNRAVITMMGAAGGFGGLPTAMAELPLTTTILLRTIQDVAVAHGFDPSEPGVTFDCIEVFGTAGPLEHDDSAELAFIGTRMTLTGVALQRLILRVSPRFGTVLGQKLAAQTVPVLGAAAGAATNYAYTSYYQQMAEVHFGLRRLAIDAGMDHAAVIADFRRRAARPHMRA